MEERVEMGDQLKIHYLKKKEIVRNLGSVWRKIARINCEISVYLHPADLPGVYPFPRGLRSPVNWGFTVSGFCNRNNYLLKVSVVDVSQDMEEKPEHLPHCLLERRWKLITWERKNTLNF